MQGKRNWFRVVLIGVLVVLVGIVGYIGYLFVYGGPENELKAAKNAYAQGVKALESGNASTAVLRFQEAKLKAIRTIELVDGTRERNKDVSAEKLAQFNQTQGEAYWLRARALRDEAFAAAAAEGKPIADSEDSTTGEKYRAIDRVPDLKMRGEAIACMREALRKQPTSPEILKDSLRTELMLTPMNWGVVEPIIRQMADSDSADARVLYLLARHEFDQPVVPKGGGNYQPTPLEKRSRDRMLKARDYLVRARDAKGYQLWRSLHLEAQVAIWLRDFAEFSKKPAERDKEDRIVRELLLDDRAGVFARANAGEGINPTMSAWDIEGLYETLMLAIDLTVLDVRAKRLDPARLESLCDELLNCCEKRLAEGKDSPTWLADTTATAVNGVSRIEPFVPDFTSTPWQKRLDRVQALARQCLDKQVARLDVYERVAQLLARQAHIHARRGEKGRQTVLTEEVTKWVEAGLKIAEQNKLPASQTAGLHELAANLYYVGNANRAEMRKHLDALRGLQDPRGAAMANLLEGAIYEREGRLDKAREALERVLASPAREFTLRAHMILANLYLAVGQPAKALASLAELQQIYGQHEQLSPQEKAWVYEFLRSPEELTFLTLAANLDTARAKIAQFRRDRPREQVPADLVKANEDAVQRLRKAFSPPSNFDRAARSAIIAYLGATARSEQALQEVAALQKDYPESLEALRLEVSLLVLPPPGQSTSAVPDPDRVKQADERIQAFLSRDPSNLRARLLWAEWLMRSNRADQAVAYLEDRGNFPGVQENQHKHLLALAYIRKGDNEQANKLLQHLPRNANVDAALIQIAGTPEEQEKRLSEALTRHERAGSIRCWEAALQYQRGQFADAATSYFQALEFTRVKPVAVAGLQRSLFALAAGEPRKARELALQFLKDIPSESSLLLSIAFASLVLDEIGDPADAWTRTVTMGSALNQWELLAKDEPGRDLVTVPLTKGEFWALANRVDLANREVQRAVSREPQNERALNAAIAVALNSGDLELLPQAEKQLAALRQAKPDDVALLAQQARLEELLGRTAEATRTYQTILEKDPKNSPAYNRIVMLMGRQEPTAVWIKKWRSELPDDLAGIRSEIWYLAANQKLPEARQLADRLLKEQVQKFADRLAAQKPPAGVDAKEWEKRIKNALEDAPLEMSMQAALAFQQAGAMDEAEGWIKRVLEKRPDAEQVLLILGEIYVSRQAWQPAREIYTKILAKNPNNAIAANNLAWVLAAKLNLPADAYSVIQKFVLGRHSQKKITGDRLRPEFLDTLGIVYQKLAKPELYPEMRDLFESARKRYPNDPRMYLYLGNAYASLQDRQKAQEMFNAAIALAGSTAKSPLTAAERQEVLEAAQQAQKKLP